MAVSDNYELRKFANLRHIVRKNKYITLFCKFSPYSTLKRIKNDEVTDGWWLVRGPASVASRRCMYMSLFLYEFLSFRDGFLVDRDEVVVALGQRLAQTAHYSVDR